MISKHRNPLFKNDTLFSLACILRGMCAEVHTGTGTSQEMGVLLHCSFVYVREEESLRELGAVLFMNYSNSLISAPKRTGIKDMFVGPEKGSRVF